MTTPTLNQRACALLESLESLTGADRTEELFNAGEQLLDDADRAGEKIDNLITLRIGQEFLRLGIEAITEPEVP